MIPLKPWTNGTPENNYQDGTQLNAADFDSWNRELVGVLDAAGIAPDAAAFDQLLMAIKKLSLVQAATAFTSAGAAPNFTLTPVPALAAYSAGVRYRVKFNAAGNGADTLNISELGAKSLKQYDSAGNKVTAVIAANQLADVEYDGVDFVILDPLPPVASRQIQSITAGAPSSGALPITYSGGTLDFRNGTLNNGTPNAGVVVPSNSITLPSGATLGLTATQQGRIVFLEAYNGGSPVLCVVNLAGGLQLDEANLISPTMISSGATAANVIYSASAVSANSPYRVVGFMDITQAVAGTWVAPSLVQGAGGQALAAMASLGYGQTYQDVTASRATGTAYYNFTGRTIHLFIVINAAGPGTRTVTVNGVTFPVNIPNATNSSAVHSFPIPPYASYSMDGSVSKWIELR